MTKTIVAFFLIGSLLAGRSAAEGISEQFHEANQLYSEGRFQQAAELYEDLLKSGAASGEIYYNLGNAYFRLNQLGRAILSYERALRLSPQDEDLLANLSYVQSLLEQAQPAEELRWAERAALAFGSLFSPSGWAIAVVACWNLLFILLLLALFVARIRRPAVRLAWAAGFVTAFCFVLAFTRIASAARGQEGVVIQREVDVRYSPTLLGAVAFQLHEGIKAKVIRCEGQWCYIRLTQDKSGWVERGMIEII